MEQQRIKLMEIQIKHDTKECASFVIPKFFFLTSEGRLRISGYCYQCGAEIAKEFDLAELQKICPTTHGTTLVLTAESPSTSISLEAFEPPEGSRPN